MGYSLATLGCLRGQQFLRCFIPLGYLKVKMEVDALECSGDQWLSAITRGWNIFRHPYHSDTGLVGDDI
jgi:hypothetical protein